MRNLVRWVTAIFFVWPRSLALATGPGNIFVSIEKGDAVVVLDPELNIIKTIPTSRRPRDMHIDPTGQKLYVACGDDDAIDIIDLTTLEDESSIATGPSPELFAFAADGKSLYVSNEDASTLEQIDLAMGQPLGEISTGAEPEGVLVLPDGKTIYAASEVADLVHVIDTATGVVTKSIEVGTRPRRFVVTPTGEVWVSDELSGEVSVIDPRTNTLRETLSFVPPGFRKSDVNPVGMALTPDGTRVLVTLGHANHLAVVDAATRAVLGYILVGQRPWSVAPMPDNRTAIVADGLSDTITLVDLRSMKPVRSVAVGRIPHTILVDE